MNNNTASDQPPTNARLVIVTSHGQIEIELWGKEAPLAAKNFIQLALQSYYNDTYFHRVIPGFMIQGGDPTGTGTGGRSIYGAPFKDQFHQRLKFNRRGILAMANSGKNTNGSQFFITFAECEHLNKKHTIFGKVVGDTIYNLMSLQSLDTDGTDRPTDPPRIKKIKILLNPFEEIQIKDLKEKQQQQKIIKQAQEQKNKILKQEQNKLKMQKKEEVKKLKKKNKLTFDIDEEEKAETYRVKSSHDVLVNDERLSNKIAITPEQIQKKKKQREEDERKVQEARDQILLNNSKEDEKDLNSLLEEVASKKKRMHTHDQKTQPQDQILNFTQRYNPDTNKHEILWNNQDSNTLKEIQEAEEEEIQDQSLRNIRQLQKKQYQGLMADELSFKKIKQGSKKDRRKMLLSQETALLSNAQKIRYQYLKKTKIDSKETKMFDKLNSFTAKISSVSQTNDAWIQHKLKFHIDSDNAYRLDQKKRLVHDEEGLDFDDGGLKVEFQQNVPDQKEFTVDQLYDLIHEEQQHDLIHEEQQHDLIHEEQEQQNN